MVLFRYQVCQQLQSLLYYIVKVIKSCVVRFNSIAASLTYFL